MKQVYWTQLQVSHPEAASALHPERVDIEETDLTFHVSSDGTLFSQSHDERGTWKWDAIKARWSSVQFPLNTKDNS